MEILTYLLPFVVGAITSYRFPNRSLWLVALAGLVPHIILFFVIYVGVWNSDEVEYPGMVAALLIFLWPFLLLFSYFVSLVGAIAGRMIRLWQEPEPEDIFSRRDDGEDAPQPARKITQRGTKSNDGV